MVVAVTDTVSPDIPFGPDDSCSSRVSCPRLNLYIT